MSLITDNLPMFISSLWGIFALILLAVFYINYKALTSYEKHPESYEMLVNCLKEDKFGKIYRDILGWILDKLADWLGDKPKFKPRYIWNKQQGHQLTPFNRFFASNPFTPASYEALLRLAFVYPILSFLVFWAMGADGTIGGINWLGDRFIFPAGMVLKIRWQLLLFGFVVPAILLLWLKRQTLKTQWVSLGILSLLLTIQFSSAVSEFWTFFLIFFLPIYLFGWLTAWLKLKNKSKAHQLIYLFAIVVAFAYAVVWELASVFSGVIGFAAVFAFVIVVTFSSTIAGTGSAAFAVALVAMSANVDQIAVVGTSAGVLYIVQIGLQRYSQNKQKEAVFWIIYSLIFIGLAVYLINSVPTDGKIFLLFYLLFPILNAPIDWLSLGITRGLLNSIRHEHHGGYHAFAWALLDVVLAIGFLLLVSAILVVTLGIVDKDLLLKILDGLRNNGSDINHYWVYAMLLSTLVPTLIHFIIAASALTLWLPQHWRHWVATNLHQNHYKILIASTYLTITPVIGILASGGLLYGLYQLLKTQGNWLANSLLTWADWLAAIV